MPVFNKFIDNSGFNSTTLVFVQDQRFDYFTVRAVNPKDRLVLFPAVREARVKVTRLLAQELVLARAAARAW